MARIKIKDLPKKDMELTAEEIRKVLGGSTTLIQNQLTLSAKTLSALTLSSPTILREPPTFMERNEIDEFTF